MSQYKGVLATITSASSNLPDHDNSGFKNSPDNFSARSPAKELPLKKIEKSPTSSKPIGIEAEEVPWPSPHSKVAESTLGQISNSMEIIGYNPWEVSDASRFLRYCCPECDFRNENLEEFSEHALQNHILANTLFVPGKDTIKLESSHESIGSDFAEDSMDIESTDFEQFEDVSENKENVDSEPLSPYHEGHSQEGHAQEGHIQLENAQHLF